MQPPHNTYLKILITVGTLATLAFFRSREQNRVDTAVNAALGIKANASYAEREAALEHAAQTLLKQHHESPEKSVLKHIQTNTPKK